MLGTLPTLGAAGRNLICQDPSPGCFKPLPTLLQLDSLWPSLSDFPTMSLGQDQCKAPKKPRRNAGEARCCLWALFSYWKHHKGDLSLRCCAGLGDGPCGPHVAAPLTFLMWSVLVSVMLGVLQLHSHVLGFSQWYLNHE